MVFPEHIVERFWRKVDKSGGEDACWPWMAQICNQGYGKFRTQDGVSGMKLAHRLALTMTVGASPIDKPLACHYCDNRRCCNPRHLRWGTMSDNMRDKSERNKEWRKVNAEHLSNMREQWRLKRLTSKGEAM